MNSFQEKAEEAYLLNLEACQGDEYKWLSVAHDIWRQEISDDEKLSGLLLAKVHQTHDIFLLAKEAIAKKQLGTFDVLHLVESTIPYLADIPVDSLLMLISVQHESTKNDLAGGVFFNKLEDKLTSLPDTCKKIRSHLLTQAAETNITIYSVALISLAKSAKAESLDFALKDSQSDNAFIKSAAIWTLGRFLFHKYFQDDDVKKISENILHNISSDNECVKNSALRAAAMCLHQLDTFDTFIKDLAESKNQYVLGLLAHTMSLNKIEFKKKADFNNWLQVLTKTAPESINSLNEIDYLLSDLINDEDEEINRSAMSWLTSWCRENHLECDRNEKTTVVFDSTVSSLTKKPHILFKLVTAWLCDDDRKLAIAAKDMMSYLWVHGFKELEFDKTQLDTFSKGGFIFLARRLLGYVFHYENQISLVMSLLKTKNAKDRTYSLVEQLFVNEIGQDYPGPTIEALEKYKLEHPDIDEFISIIISKIKKPIDELEQLPRLQELQPPSHLLREFDKARAKQMSESTENASKGSIFRALCTEIPIKAGRGSFSFRGAAYSEPSYMQEYSYSTPIPMRHVRDAVGQEMAQLLYSLAKREEQ